MVLPPGGGQARNHRGASRSTTGSRSACGPPLSASSMSQCTCRAASDHSPPTPSRLTSRAQSTVVAQYADSRVAPQGVHQSGSSTPPTRAGSGVVLCALVKNEAVLDRGRASHKVRLSCAVACVLPRGGATASAWRSAVESTYAAWRCLRTSTRSSFRKWIKKSNSAVRTPTAWSCSTAMTCRRQSLSVKTSPVARSPA